MSAEIIAKRYANALLNHSTRAGLVLSDVASALDGVCGLFDVVEAAKVLRSPVMPKSLKKELLQYGLESTTKMGELLAFLKVVVDTDRTQILPNICQAFRVLSDRQQNIVRAELITACEVDNGFEEVIKSYLKSETGKESVLTRSVDPDLLGGFSLKVGHKILDLSLKTKVKALTAEVTV